MNSNRNENVMNRLGRVPAHQRLGVKNPRGMQQYNRQPNNIGGYRGRGRGRGRGGQTFQRRQWQQQQQMTNERINNAPSFNARRGVPRRQTQQKQLMMVKLKQQVLQAQQEHLQEQQLRLHAQELHLQQALQHGRRNNVTNYDDGLNGSSAGRQVTIDDLPQPQPQGGDGVMSFDNADNFASADALRSFIKPIQTGISLNSRFSNQTTPMFTNNPANYASQASQNNYFDFYSN